VVGVGAGGGVGAGMIPVRPSISFFGAPSESFMGTPRDPSPVIPGQRGRALVVDDTASVLKITRRTLTLAGYEVETAENGQEALEVLKALFLTGKEELWFAVVVMDLQMPVMGELSRDECACVCVCVCCTVLCCAVLCVLYAI
jgi:hypothetical protein